MNNLELLVLVTLLLFKHLICDFPLQGPYQYLNKGTYLHPGGLLHAGIHFVGSVSVLAPFGFQPWFLLVIAGECLIHYHTDWAKVNICKKYGWGPTTSDYYFWSLGIDQFIHQLSYVGVLLACYHNRIFV